MLKRLNHLLKEYKQKRRKKKLLKKYAGNRVTCVICNSHFHEFAPMKKRPNAQCPECGSFERHRLFWKYAESKTNLFKNQPLKVLHFAPEKVFYDYFNRYENFSYYPCDLYPNDQIGDIKKMSITEIQYDDNYFDIISCNHVLEHIEDDLTAMRELHRVLKSGGWAILQVPIDYNRETTYEDFSITTPEGRLKAFGQSDHVRWYGRDYKDRLAAVGFNVNEDDFVKSFSEADLFRFGLMKSELIYYVTK